MRFASFAIDTPIFVGDIVELPDARWGEGGVERRHVAKSTPSTAGPGGMSPRSPSEAGIRARTTQRTPLGLPVILGPQTSPDVGLCVRAEPGEPVLDQGTNLVPVRTGDAVEELCVAVPVRRRGRIRASYR